MDLNTNVPNYIRVLPACYKPFDNNCTDCIHAVYWCADAPISFNWGSTIKRYISDMNATQTLVETWKHVRDKVPMDMVHASDLSDSEQEKMKLAYLSTFHEQLPSSLLYCHGKSSTRTFLQHMATKSVLSEIKAVYATSKQSIQEYRHSCCYPTKLMDEEEVQKLLGYMFQFGSTNFCLMRNMFGTINNVFIYPKNEHPGETEEEEEKELSSDQLLIKKILDTFHSSKQSCSLFMDFETKHIRIEYLKDLESSKKYMFICSEKEIPK